MKTIPMPPSPMMLTNRMFGASALVSSAHSGRSSLRPTSGSDGGGTYDGRAPDAVTTGVSFTSQSAHAVALALTGALQDGQRGRSFRNRSSAASFTQLRAGTCDCITHVARPLAGSRHLMLN